MCASPRSCAGSAAGPPARLPAHLPAHPPAPLPPAAQVLAEALPRTAHFMRAAAAAAPELERALTAAGVPASPAAASPTPAAAGVPASLRTGMAPRSASASPSGGAPGGAAPVRPAFPVQLRSWKGTFRSALLAAVAADAPAAGPQLAEVLQHDRERLHAGQNAFQQLVVMAAGLLIVQQFRQQQGLGWTAEERAAARRRLLVVLADAGMRLGDLVTEITRLSGGPASEQGQAPGQGLALEPQVRQVFMGIVDPSSGPYRSIRQALAAALLAHLLHGGAAVAADERLGRGLSALLGKVGARPPPAAAPPCPCPVQHSRPRSCPSIV
jgi:hypothetical protein